MYVLNVADSSAHICRYIDKDGTECFTDSLQSIPEEYRKKAVVVKEIPEKEDNKPKEGTEEKKGSIRSVFGNKLFKTIAAITGFIIAFIITGRIGNSLGFVFFTYSICISRRWLAFLSH